jgi:hypothetical protein
MAPGTAPFFEDGHDALQEIYLLDVVAVIDAVAAQRVAEAQSF